MGGYSFIRITPFQTDKSGSNGKPGTDIEVELMGGCYLIAAQFLGVFGSFFGGSCTVSNILFASLQFNSAQILKIPADVVLALQNTGSGLGGMIRISGVIAACAAVKIDKKTGDVLLLNLIPLIVFSILALLTALFFC